MVSYFVAFLCSLSVGALLTLVVRNLALRFGLVEQSKSSRKIHTRAVPRLGGIAIVGGFFAPLIGLLLIDTGVGETFKRDPGFITSLFLGGFAIAVLGLYDDLRGANAKLKFLVQFSVAGAMYAAGLRIENLANPLFGGSLELGLVSLPFTLLWVVGIINALNLIDGLDGLAGGVAFFAVATNFVLALVRADVLLTLAMAALAGALLGFLIFNFNPASIFMGDTGSMFLGFVLAVVSIKTSHKSGTAVALVVPIIALGLPIMDTMLAMGRRLLTGRPMFSADKEHIHHRMFGLVLSHRKAVLLLYGVSVMFGLSALGLMFANSAQSAMILSAVAIVVFVLMRKLGYLNLANRAQVRTVRGRNAELRTLSREVIRSLRDAKTLQGVWDALRPVCFGLNAGQMVLKVQVCGSADEMMQALTFESVREAGRSMPLDARIELRSGTGAFGELIVSWRDGRLEVNRDEELMLEIVADTVAEACARITGRRISGSHRVIALSR